MIELRFSHDRGGSLASLVNMASNTHAGLGCGCWLPELAVQSDSSVLRNNIPGSPLIFSNHWISIARALENRFCFCAAINQRIKNRFSAGTDICCDEYKAANAQNTKWDRSRADRVSFTNSFSIPLFQEGYLLGSFPSMSGSLTTKRQANRSCINIQQRS